MAGVGDGGAGFHFSYNSIGGILAIVMIIGGTVTQVRGCFESKDIADGQFQVINAKIGSIDSHLDHIDAHLNNIDSQGLSIQAELAKQQGAQDERDRIATFEAHRRSVAGRH